MGVGSEMMKIYYHLFKVQQLRLEERAVLCPRLFLQMLFQSAHK